MSRAWILLLALSAGCASEGAAVRRQTAAPPAAASPPAAEWSTFGLPSEGVSLSFPGSATEFQKTTYTGSTRVAMHGLVFDGADKTSYWFARTNYGEDKSVVPDQKAILSGVESTFGVLEQKRDLVVQGMLARELRGMTTKSKLPVMTRAIVNGSTLYLLTAGTEGKNLDTAAATRFFDSFRLEPRLSVLASAEGRFTLLAPRDASAVDMSRHIQQARVSRLLYLGGPDERALWITVFDVQENGRTRDEILHDIATGSGAAGGGVIEKLLPISMNGVPGREGLSHMKDRFIRFRIFVVGGLAYQIAAQATNREALVASDITRMLDSLRWAPPR